MNKDNHGQKKTDEVSDNMSVTYKPPLVIKDSMIALVSEISEEIGRISILQEGHVVTPHLRRKNRIRTIHSSLMENVSLEIRMKSGRSGTHTMLTSSCWHWILFLLMTC